jgi:TrmH family RNA methyltransferase
MISKNTIKLIKSLAKKKYRIKENLFLAEGDKIVKEILNSDIKIRFLIVSELFIKENSELVSKAENVTVTSHQQIKQASLLQNPQNCVALCELPKTAAFNKASKDFTFYLDGIQDPGNLGTIIRTCDWFGIENVLTSPDSVDVFNPKVIQASMGSFCRVNVIPTEINDLHNYSSFLEGHVYGTFLQGKNIYTEKLQPNSIVILGNEGQGIRDNIQKIVTSKICIPAFSNKTNRAESLNVAISAGIICSEFRRGMH